MLVYTNENEVDIINAFRPIEFKYSRIYCPDGIEHPNLQVTNIINLEQDIDLIYQNFSKNIKNETNKCKKNDEPFFEYVSKCNNEIIDDFIKKYQSFAEDKSCAAIKNVIEEVYNSHLNFANKNCLIISKIGSNKMSKKHIIFHTYLIDENSKTVRLLASISNYRHLKIEDKKIIGRLNRLLHFEDIKYFKDLGYYIYDFGCVNLTAKDGDGKNIADFKLGFSKKFLKYYYGKIHKKNTEKSKKFCLFKNVFSKYKKICLIYDKKTYNIAVNIVNQLADNFYFEIVYVNNFNIKNYYKKFDILHDLTNTIKDKKVVHFNKIAYSPYVYFPIKAKNRGGKMKFVVLDDEELSKKLGLKNIEIDTLQCSERELNKKLNLFDIAIISENSDKQNILFALGAGNEVIVHSKHNFEAKMTYNCEDELQTLIKNYDQNPKCLNEKMMARVREIEKEYSFYKISPKYKNFYENVRR